ncbi:Malate/lactate/ureidoglycolate dehydrogenase, LDH2 family [Streptomyces sp. Ag82_O1-12]|uniref:Ldh family oxidoreductase n=1 Tax=unclassified Streptomyces TaxID=2593676 RepID=UPI000BCBFD83|nr:MULTISPECIES: Ldh family oxidoreductase [unclassified Streptomyces]SMQ19499.1 Malate/lactate/ureidoglycolate dehydrogenase, LDH2 family [Streptomyces sp. Ag82_O1-12]SOD48540.1 Malate/lactate/ureidoglycolate dehydrogenase, LDH2 family [Streptomyces sp. Ag82_G6-1]
MTAPTAPRTAVERTTVLVDHAELHASLTGLFTGHGVPDARARLAADALCHGDLTGLDSHGVFNLTRLYLPLLESGRCDPRAQPETLTDLGACVVVDARRALGLWAAAEAMDEAVARAGRHGVGLVSVRGATHFGCAGFHAVRAAHAGMIGVVASNCGGQRIARPPGGAVAMLGTNPLSVAAPALDGHPFLLDMSTTVAPTGRVRVAARRGTPVPAGWLEDAAGAPVTDPSAFDRGEAFLRWLGGTSETGVHKGYGLGIAVELLAAVVSGAAVGPAPAALEGDGRPHGSDDGIGFFLLAIAPEVLRPGADVAAATRSLFGTLADCPPVPGGEPVRYPGWREAELAAERRRHGIPLPAHLHAELTDLGLLGGPGSPR